MCANLHKCYTNGKAHMYSNNQLHMDMDTIVSFVIQSGQVWEGRAISLSRHVSFFKKQFVCTYLDRRPWSRVSNTWHRSWLTYHCEYYRQTPASTLLQTQLSVDNVGTHCAQESSWKTKKFKKYRKSVKELITNICMPNQLTPNYTKLHHTHWWIQNFHNCYLQLKKNVMERVPKVKNKHKNS